MIYIQDDLTITPHEVRAANGTLLSMQVAEEAEPLIRRYLPFVRLITVGEGEERKVVDAQEDKEARAAYEAANTPSDAELLEQKKNEVRARRAALLRAFDTYKANVYYGIESETSDEKTAILAWYSGLLELPEAVTLEEETIWPETPERITRYLTRRNEKWQA